MSCGCMSFDKIGCAFSMRQFASGDDPFVGDEVMRWGVLRWFRSYLAVLLHINSAVVLVRFVDVGEHEILKVTGLSVSRRCASYKLRTIVDGRPQDKPSKVNDCIGEHDGQAHPHNPAFTTVFPIIDRARCPTAVLSNGREHSPANDSARSMCKVVAGPMIIP